MNGDGLTVTRRFVIVRATAIIMYVLCFYNMCLAPIAQGCAERLQKCLDIPTAVPAERRASPAETAELLKQLQVRVCEACCSCHVSHVRARPSPSTRAKIRNATRCTGQGLLETIISYRPLISLIMASMAASSRLQSIGLRKTSKFAGARLFVPKPKARTGRVFARLQAAFFPKTKAIQVILGFWSGFAHN